MDTESSSCKRKQRSELEEITEIGKSLPEDVVIEILIRMPVKSLLKFKRVCKRWYNLIESPRFIRYHYDNPNNHTRLLARYCNTIYDETCHHSVAIYPDQPLTDSPIVYDDITQFHLVSSISIDWMIGPVDGLFVPCLSFNDEHSRLALWNPATSEFMYIPKSKLKNMDYLVGFGLDLSNMKYKVVWRNFTGSGPTGLYTFDCESESCVFSVIQKKDSFDEVVKNLSRLYLNGKFYWLLMGKLEKVFLVSFDMSTDEFKMIQGPPTFSNRGGVLTEINGSIALIESGHGHTWCESVNSWVLNGASWWTKNYNTCYENYIPYGLPLGFWNDMKELIYQSCRGELMLFDLHNEVVKKHHLGIHGDYEMGMVFYMEAYKYKESLFSFSRGIKEKLRKDELLSMFKNFSIVDGDNDDDEVQNRADKRRK